MTTLFSQIITGATDEQKIIIKEASASSAIISCPGSGKTFTTSLRMAQRLTSWGSRYSGIALLSHSNIAIKSFQDQFKQLGLHELPRLPHFVGTIDSFITCFLLANYGHLAMGSTRRPLLVWGGENFLRNPKFNVFFDKGSDGQYPENITKLGIGINQSGKPYIFKDYFGSEVLPKDAVRAMQTLRDLGKYGFYTHEQGRYWGSRVLEHVPRICEVLAHRFPEIIVDEAQDTNPWQQRVLCQLEEAGVKLMLVGDPDQSIFEFGLGNASHLKQHSAKVGIDKKRLSKNLRSNQRIVNVAKSFCSTPMSTDLACDSEWQGAYVVVYTPNEECEIVAAFRQSIERCGLNVSKCAVLARSNDLVKKLRGDSTTFNNTPTHRFAKAALLRDHHKNLPEAYGICETLVWSLCGGFQKWREKEGNPDASEHRLLFRKKLWNYVRDPKRGLPCSSLKAKSEWHPKLKVSLESLLRELSHLPDITYPKYLGQNVSTRELLDHPVIDGASASTSSSTIRIDTVHGVKGETLDAVLYVVTEKHLIPLIKRLEGDTSENELVKIGYVAMTRPKHLLWLAVPSTSLRMHRSTLAGAGFRFVD
jgi:superfamily I DNA/RNA helicase